MVTNYTTAQVRELSVDDFRRLSLFIAERIQLHRVRGWERLPYWEWRLAGQLKAERRLRGWQMTLFP
jgi:hypothetical protein